jgi:hypothetical protein
MFGSSSSFSASHVHAHTLFFVIVDKPCSRPTTFLSSLFACHVYELVRSRFWGFKRAPTLCRFSKYLPASARPQCEIACVQDTKCVGFTMADPSGPSSIGCWIYHNVSALSNATGFRDGDWYEDPPLFVVPTLTLEKDGGLTPICRQRHVCEHRAPAHSYSTCMPMKCLVPTPVMRAV